ncbi:MULTISPECIES: beta-ketoacyl synthase N-terminal-like domain-containing protein [Amycolatopsis]|uniref:Beta-ketoacyl synthase N-terminal-like domain-containing protein n=1 Tax=Amycolatopsis albidoflavus TaxID=102226 RepID=A0ABW5I7T3_9PSEU
MRAVAIRAWSAHLPGQSGPLPGGWSPGPACPPERAADLLGRKGLLYKQPAERLGLCAVHRALGLAPVTGRWTPPEPDPRTAVVASSNLGSLETVCAVARTAGAGSLSDVSPLDAPNVSSNVLASTVAIRFGFGGPNLMVCSGHPAGLDAMRLAQLLLAAGRADRVVVVGAEPADETAAALAGADLRAGAACVVLEPAAEDSALVLHPVHDHADPESCEPARPVRFGQFYGAAGVLAVAAAAAANRTARVVAGSDADGWRCAVVETKGDR